MIGYIYKITYLPDGRIYIGQTKHSTEDRVKDHFNNKSNTPFDNFCYEHNIEDFSIETIEELEAETQKKLKFLMDERERYYISYYNSFDPTLEHGFNKTKGGYGNSGLSGVNSVNYGRRHSPEVNKKKARYGEESARWGKHHTEETKKKISEAHKRIPKEQHPWWGKHHTEETKKKIAEAKKGHIPWNKGLKYTIKHKNE